MRGNQFLIRNQAVLLQLRDDQYKAIGTDLTLEPVIFTAFGNIQVVYVEIFQ